MAFIYKIVNDVNGKLYIGKTTKTIEERYNRHLQNARNKVNRYLYDAMNHYGVEHFSISLIEECVDNIVISNCTVSGISVRQKLTGLVKGYKLKNIKYGK